MEVLRLTVKILTVRQNFYLFLKTITCKLDAVRHKFLTVSHLSHFRLDAVLAMKITEQLHYLRSKLGLSQAEAASKFEIPLGSWKKYEKGPSEPGSGALRCLAEGGININWLLTGHGPMLLADFVDANSIAPVPASAVDYPLLQSLIEMLENALDEKSLMLPARRKAAAIQIMYEYCLLDGKAATPATIERFLKLVA